MTTIWKFRVPVTDVFELELPEGARFLSVQAQHGEPQSWWLVDPHAGPVKRSFRLHGTGHQVRDADRLTFLGTFQMQQGRLVFHMFEAR